MKFQITDGNKQVCETEQAILSYIACAEKYTLSHSATYHLNLALLLDASWVDLQDSYVCTVLCAGKHTCFVSCGYTLRRELYLHFVRPHFAKAQSTIPYAVVNTKKCGWLRRLILFIKFPFWWSWKLQQEHYQVTHLIQDEMYRTSRLSQNLLVDEFVQPESIGFWHKGL